MSENKKIVAGNWKMHKTRKDVEQFFAELSDLPPQNKVRCILAPSTTLLETAVKFGKSKSIEIFAQNCFGENQGAFTGENSPLQLKDLGVVGSLVGHSERRQFFGETNESCLKRTLGLWQNQLEVIYCIGEQLNQRQNNETHAVLKTQLSQLINSFKAHLSENKFCKLVIAYEPVWAIGTGLTAESHQIVDAHKMIRNEFLSSGVKESQIPSILYGGSVKTNNFKEISSLDFVDGGLIGGASLKAEDFVTLAKCAAQ